MPALMSLNANKIYLDYHLGNEIQYICRVNENRHLIRVIWNLYLIGFNFGDTLTNIKMSAIDFNKFEELSDVWYKTTVTTSPMYLEICALSFI